MASRVCPTCGAWVQVVPHITDEEIGVVPQFLARHRVDQRAFVGPWCDGSRLPVQVWAHPKAQS